MNTQSHYTSSQADRRNATQRAARIGAQILGITPLKSYIRLGIMAWGGAGNGCGVATFGAEHANHACDGTQNLTLPVGTGRVRF